MPLPALDGTLLDGGRLELAGDVSRADPDLARERLARRPDRDLERDQPARRADRALRPHPLAEPLRPRSASTGRKRERHRLRRRRGRPAPTGSIVLDARLTWDLRRPVRRRDAGRRRAAPGPRHRRRRDRRDRPGRRAMPNFTAASLTLSRLQRLGDGAWSLWLEAIGQLASHGAAELRALLARRRHHRPRLRAGQHHRRLRLRRPARAAPPGRRRLGGAARRPSSTPSPTTAAPTTGRATRDGEQWEELGSVGIGARIDVRPWLTLTPEIARQTDGVATDTTETRPRDPLLHRRHRPLLTVRRAGRRRPGCLEAAGLERRGRGRMRILITNDDGITAPGLARRRGDRRASWPGPTARSGWWRRPSSSRASRTRSPTSARCGWSGWRTRRFAVEGSPADCVLAGALRDPQGRAARPGDLRRQPRPQRRRGHALFRHRRRRDGGGAARACARSRCRSTTGPAGAADDPFARGARARRRRWCGGCSTARAWPSAPYARLLQRQLPGGAGRRGARHCAPPSRATAPPRPSGCCRTSRRTGARSSG